jgi:radical SAM superfamily enzyme YgiQ (UPF0313 family)
MKILIVSVNNVLIPHPVYPLGVDYVVGSLSDRHQVKVVDMAAMDHGELQPLLAEYKPDLIGLSIRNIDSTDITSIESSFDQITKVVEVIRQNWLGLLVLGGSGFSILPVEMMEAFGADYGLIGEGERFSQLLDALENGRDVLSIPGVMVKGGSAAYPAPWDGTINRSFSQNNRALKHYLDHGGILNLQTKRGCRFNCIYCTYPLLEGRHYRLFDPEKIAREALGLENKGAKFLFVVDSIFNSDFEHSLAVAEAFKSVGLTTPWGGFFAPVPGPARYYQHLAESGLTHVEFGTDSLCPEMLKNYGKPFQLEMVFEAHQAGLEAGINIAHYLLLGGPGETKDTLNETLTNAEHLHDSVLFFFEGLRVYPGTRLYDHALESGQIQKGQNLLTPVYYQSPALKYEAISEIVAARAKGRSNWIIGGGGKTTNSLISIMHRHGHTGPLWDRRIR